MADEKITDLSDGGAIQAGDEFVIARSGSNYKIAGSEISDVWLVQILPWLGLHASSGGSWPDTADGLVSGTMLDGYATNLSGAANTDYVEWKVFLSAGTWKLEWVTRKQTFLAIQTVSLDGTSIGTFDAYNGSNVYNVIASISGISVATTGSHLLRFAVPTRNASASGWGMYLGLISLARTA